MHKVGVAYDSLAPTYDAALDPARWVRTRLWERMDVLFPPDARVLDVTAGTGLDAIHLARRGVHVVACDISSNMLAQLRAKDPTIETHVADFNHLEAGAWGLGFDGVLSTFAGLNTSPDLRSFADSAAPLLRPGGILFLHLINRWPVLDLVRRLARLRRREFWQGLTSSRRDVHLGGVRVAHYLYSPLPLYRRVFAAYFRLSRVEAQGLFRPVDAAWGTNLEAWERAVAHHAPLYSLGTFFVLELIRR